MCEGVRVTSAKVSRDPTMKMTSLKTSATALLKYVKSSFAPGTVSWGRGLLPRQPTNHAHLVSVLVKATVYAEEADEFLDVRFE